MKRAWTAAIGLALLGATVHAQTRCDGPKCIYEWNNEGGVWPDWSLWTPDSPNSVTSMNGLGWIDVHADSRRLYDGNHAHLTWDAIGKGYSSAWLRFKFWGDTGKTGWLEKWTDGNHGPDAECHALSHAPIAADEALLITLYDDGESYVGALIGGDLIPIGYVVPPLEGEPQHYATMAIVQKTAGDTLPQVLDYTQGNAILQRGTDVRLKVNVWQDPVGTWRIEAIGDKKTWGEQHFRISSKMLEAPNPKGSVGLDAVVLAKPYCIYYPGGSISRRFRLSELTVWK